MTDPMAKQLPDPTRIGRLFGGVTNFVGKTFTGRGVPHSVLFGVLSGIGLWAGIYTYRVVYLGLFDCESVPIASRQRYEEKQKLYQEKLSQEMSSSIIASLVKEYNPIHLRLPYKELPEEAKHL